MATMENRSEQTKRSHCTFCDLIRGAAEVSICHEDSDAIAFMDIQPVNNGHVLVVPRKHYESLLDVPQELGAHLFKVTMQLANAMSKVTGCNDLNIIVNSGAAAGQDEPHYHVHIIPRREGDGFDVPLPFNGSEMPDRTVLDAYAARIIAALRDPMRTERSGSRGGSTDAPTERSIALPVHADIDPKRSVDVPRPAVASRRPKWAAAEGAHGELTYDSTLDDAAAD
jgi:histidine triad (HIT) family protein